MKKRLLILTLFSLALAAALGQSYPNEQDYALPSCWIPNLVSGKSYYEYADSCNNTLEYNGSYDVSATCTLNESIKQRLLPNEYMNASIVYAIHWHNNFSHDRGLAYMLSLIHI